MKKYHIVDKKLRILDTSNNMLELRMICSSMNSKIGGECKVVSEEELENLKTEKQSSETGSQK